MCRHPGPSYLVAGGSGIVLGESERFRCEPRAKGSSLLSTQSQYSRFAAAFCGGIRGIHIGHPVWRQPNQNQDPNERSSGTKSMLATPSTEKIMSGFSK